MSNWGNYNFDYSNSQSANDADTPAGSYHARLRYMELGATKKGFPMIKACFVANELQAPIYINLQLVRSFDGSTNDNFMISRCNAFLESFGIVSDVRLTTLNSYESLVNYIAQKTLELNCLFGLNVSYETGKDGKQYAIYKLTRINEAPYSDNPPF